MAKALIDIRAVKKSYVSGSVETPVLFGVDLRVERGEFIAVMGQSGSGKSTLMNILGCLDQATGGDYLLDGADTLALLGRLHSSPFTAGTGTNHEHIKMFFWRSLHRRSHSKTVQE